MIRPKPDNKLLQAVEQLTLTVISLKHEVQQLHEKHSHLTQRFDSRAASVRSPSPSPYHTRQDPRNYHSPEKYYGYDPESRYKHSPPPPDQQRYHEWNNNDKSDRHHSPSRSSYQYPRYGYHDNDRSRRSSSPAPLRNGDAAPHMKDGVRFQSPERHAHSSSNRQGNFQ